MTSSSVEARRSAFLGWFGVVVTPSTVLDAGLKGHPDIAVDFTYHRGLENVVFRSGPPAAHSIKCTIDLNNGWSVEAFGVAPDRAIFASGDALGVLAAGTVGSVLLAALFFVLGTGRARALRFFGIQTGELQHQALHDALTGLPNRALIGLRIEQLVERNRHNGTDAAVLYVDLDEFKNVNDTLGHEAGDRLLQAVAARLTANLRDVDTIGRMGGDEFVVLIDGGTGCASPQLVAERLLVAMREPFIIDRSLPIVVTTTIGICAGHRDRAGELLRDADVALYSAKAAGKDCYATFDEGMSSSLQNQYELEFDLRSALDSSQFRIAYQPIYDLADLTIVGTEALLRWEHPTRGTIQPDKFIPLLESSTHIIEVGRWVLQEACRQAVVWRDNGSVVTMAVNVSGPPTRPRRHRRAGQGSPGRKWTRPGAADRRGDRDRSDARRRHRRPPASSPQGDRVQLAMDDFGTGYCSLAYLQRFPIDCIKIDRSFVNAISDSLEADTLIHTLVQLGRNLGLRTVAEAVETTEQIDFLRGEGVNQAQGFLLAHPLDPDTLETQLLQPIRPTPATADPRDR